MDLFFFLCFTINLKISKHHYVFFFAIVHSRCGTVVDVAALIMVSPLDSPSRGPGSSPEQAHSVGFFGKTLTNLSVPFSTQEYS